MNDPLPIYVAEVITCECGEEIGVADHPARSYDDGRELGPLYLHHGGVSGGRFGRTLWRVGTGDAGALEQRCPRCDVVLPVPGAPQQLTLGSA